MRLDDLAFEVFIEEIGRAHGPEADRVVHPLFAHIVEPLTDVKQLLNVADLERRGIGRLPQQQGLDELALAHDVARVSVICLGVPLRVARNLPAKRIVIVVEGEVIAVMHHRAAALVRDHLQSKLRQLQLTHDLRPQQTADIGAV